MDHHDQRVLKETAVFFDALFRFSLMCIVRPLSSNRTSAPMKKQVFQEPLVKERWRWAFNHFRDPYFYQNTAPQPLAASYLDPKPNEAEAKIVVAIPNSMQ